MPSFSDTLFRGLMTPVVDFSQLQEPLGMLMGGAEAERAKQQQLTQGIQSAYGATPEQMNALMAQVSSPEVAKMMLEAQRAGVANREIIAEQEQRRQQATQERELRGSAVSKARAEQGADFAKAIASAPLEVINEYLFYGVLNGPDDNYLVVGNNLWNKETKQWERLPQNSDGSQTGRWRPVKTDEGTMLFNDGSGELRPIDSAGGGSSALWGKFSTISTFMNTVEEAINTSKGNISTLHDALKYVPMSGERTLENLNQTIKANLAFDRLEQMRKSNKQGAGLGSITERELDLLQSSVATLDPADKNYVANLNKVLQSYRNFRSAMLGEVPDDPHYLWDKETNKIYYVEKPEKGEKLSKSDFFYLGEYSGRSDK